MITIHSRISPAQVIGDILTNHLRVVESDGELYEAAKGCVRSAIAAAETYTNRLLVESNVTMSFDRVDGRVIELPTAPIVEISAVQYMGKDGQWHDFTDYTLVGNIHRARLELHTMPDIDTARMLEVFKVSAHVGFSSAPIIDGGGSGEIIPMPKASSPSTGYWPADVVAAIKLISATLLDNPADNVTGTIASELPMNAKMLLTPYRITPYGL
jgi:hypothetical protein